MIGQSFLFFSLYRSVNEPVVRIEMCKSHLTRLTYNYFGVVLAHMFMETAILECCSLIKSMKYVIWVVLLNFRNTLLWPIKELPLESVDSHLKQRQWAMECLSYDWNQFVKNTAAISTFINALWQYIKITGVETHLKSMCLKKVKCPLSSVLYCFAFRDAANARKRELNRQFVRYGRVSWLNKLTGQM